MQMSEACSEVRAATRKKLLLAFLISPQKRAATSRPKMTPATVKVKRIAFREIARPDWVFNSIKR